MPSGVAGKGQFPDLDDSYSSVYFIIFTKLCICYIQFSVSVFYFTTKR